MKRKLPWVLLAISLAFNVSFVLGFLRAHVWSHRTRPRELQTLRQRMEMMADKLNLDARQRKQYDELIAQAEKLRQDRSSEREAFYAELIKDNPDEKVLTEYMTGQWRSDYRLEMLKTMRKLMGILRPEQRKAYVEMVQKQSDSPKK